VKIAVEERNGEFTVVIGDPTLANASNTTVAVTRRDIGKWMFGDIGDRLRFYLVQNNQIRIGDVIVDLTTEEGSKLLSENKDAVINAFIQASIPWLAGESSVRNVDLYLKPYLMANFDDILDKAKARISLGGGLTATAEALKNTTRLTTQIYGVYAPPTGRWYPKLDVDLKETYFAGDYTNLYAQVGLSLSPDLSLGRFGLGTEWELRRNWELSVGGEFDFDLGNMKNLRIYSINTKVGKGRFYIENRLSAQRGGLADIYGPESLGDKNFVLSNEMKVGILLLGGKKNKK